MAQNWSVSGDFVYFWPEEHIRKEYPDTDSAHILAMARLMASESAHYALADEPIGENYKVAILELDTDDLQREGIEFGPDASCPGMDHCIQAQQPISTQLVRRVYVGRDNLSAAKPYFVYLRQVRAEGEDHCDTVFTKGFMEEPDALTSSFATLLRTDKDGQFLCRLHEEISEAAQDSNAWEELSLQVLKCRPASRVRKLYPDSGTERER